MTSVGAMNLAADATTVRVTWTSEGELGNNPLKRWLGLWLDQPATRVDGDSCASSGVF